jgi:hypothetical protein
MKRFQDLKIGDIVGVLRLGGNNVLDFNLNFKEYTGIGDLWTYEISYYSKENLQFEVNIFPFLNYVWYKQYNIYYQTYIL